MRKKIAILGSTGSIGTATLQVIEHLADQYEVVGLAAHSNAKRLEEQIVRFRPRYAALYDRVAAQSIKTPLPLLFGMEGLKEVAACSGADLVVCAMAGTRGLEPTLAAIDAGKNIALANKEVLVSGGALVMERVRQKGVDLLPIDSEHSALFQCLLAGKKEEVQRLILTASGGPFRSFSLDQLSAVTVEQALNHPNWVMGPKVTVDSSTLMNKGLELIEAYWLFGLPISQIEVVIHPQSIIHSMVEYRDGSIMAQMGMPTMLVPIQYALTYPHRSKGLLKPFDFIAHPRLEFMPVDLQKFRCLDMAFEALKRGKSAPAYLNAANEVLVERFLSGQIPWRGIGDRLATLMDKHVPQPMDSLESIIEIDTQARREAQ